MFEGTTWPKVNSDGYEIMSGMKLEEQGKGNGGVEQEEKHNSAKERSAVVAASVEDLFWHLDGKLRTDIPRAYMLP
jgi:hypothetical protein